MKSDFGTWPRKERFPDVSANIALAMFRTSDSLVLPRECQRLQPTNWNNFRTYLVEFFSTYIPCILIIIKVFSPTDGQLDSLKNNFKFALKLTLKRSYMFRCETPSSGSSIPSEPC